MPDALTRFLDKVAIGDPDDCWPWLGHRDPGGYGRFTVWSEVRRPQLAHRWIVSHLRGPLPPSSVVMHTCDNPPCVNPLHLRVGTHADNVADKIAKGRARWASHYATATHCVHGHPFDDVNTYTWTNPATGRVKRICRACSRARRRAA